jgi:hypothetical protein
MMTIEKSISIIKEKLNVDIIPSNIKGFKWYMEDTESDGTNFISDEEVINLANEQNIMINKIYCDICSQASVETLQIITEETFYCCTMCRDNNEDREIKDNNFYEDCVIDYKS